MCTRFDLFIGQLSSYKSTSRPFSKLGVSAKLGEYKFLVHENNGRSFWATDDKSMMVRKPPAGTLNNICRYEGGPVFAITRDDDGTTQLTIKENVNPHRNTYFRY